MVWLALLLSLSPFLGSEINMGYACVMHQFGLGNSHKPKKLSFVVRSCHLRNICMLQNDVLHIPVCFSYSWFFILCYSSFRWAEIKQIIFVCSINLSIERPKAILMCAVLCVYSIHMQFVSCFNTPYSYFAGNQYVESVYAMPLGISQ